MCYVYTLHTHKVYTFFHLPIAKYKSNYTPNPLFTLIATCVHHQRSNLEKKRRPAHPLGHSNSLSHTNTYTRTQSKIRGHHFGCPIRIWFCYICPLRFFSATYIALVFLCSSALLWLLLLLYIMDSFPVLSVMSGWMRESSIDAMLYRGCSLARF